MSRRPSRVIAFVGAAAALSACFTSTADFKSDAEDYIASDVAEALTTDDDPVVFESVNCVSPVDQNVGTRFTCTAIDQSGGVWEFDNVIDAPNEFTVNVARRP